jgi:hypothetical protein
VAGPGKTRLGWTTISLVKTKGSLAGKGEWTPGRYLLAATGLMHNSGVLLKKVSPDRISGAGVTEAWAARPQSSAKGFRRR